MEHVNSGQKLAIPAATFNCMVDAAKDFKARQSRQGGGDQVFTRLDPVTVLLTNPDGKIFPRFHAAVIGEPAIPPDDQLSGGGMGSFFDAPNFKAMLAGGTLTETIAIIDDPISTGDINTLNRAIISGCSACLIKVNNETDQYARTFHDHTYLETAGSGQFRILWKEAVDSADGLRWAYGVVNCDSSTAAALGYNGYFRTSRQSDTSVFVGAPRGWSEESIDTVAGYVCFDDCMITIPTATLNFTHSDFVSLEVDIAAKTAILKAEHSFPTFSGNIIRVPIAYVEFDATETKIQDVIQLQYGIVYLGTGSGYNGYFKVKKTAAMQLAVVDGYSDTEPQCGYVRLDNNFYPVPPVSAMTVTGSGHVILTIDRSAAVVAPALSIRFADDDTDPFDFTAAPATDVIELPLAYVLVDDSGSSPLIAEIQQLQYDIPYGIVYLGAGIGSGYNGYFKVKKTAAMELAVVDGYSDSEVQCGYVRLDNNFYPVPKSSGMTVTGSGHVILTIDRSDAVVAPALSIRFADDDADPFDFTAAPETDVIELPLAYVLVDDSGSSPLIAEIQQLQYDIPCLLNTAPYDGYFAVTDVSDDYVIAVSVAAGKILIDLFYDAGPVSITVDESGYIILDINTTTGIVVTNLLFNADINFELENNHIQIPIAYVKYGSKIMPDGTDGVGIYNIKQLQYGTLILDVLKFPALIQDYDADIKLVMVCDKGAYKWIEAGSCDASPGA